MASYFIKIKRTDLEDILKRSKMIDLIVSDLENKAPTVGFITKTVRTMLNRE